MGKSKLSDLPRSQEYSDKKTLQSIFPAHFCSAADGISYYQLSLCLYRSLVADNAEVGAPKLSFTNSQVGSLIIHWMNQAVELHLVLNYRLKCNI